MQIKIGGFQSQVAVLKQFYNARRSLGGLFISEEERQTSQPGRAEPGETSPRGVPTGFAGQPTRRDPLPIHRLDSQIHTTSIQKNEALGRSQSL
jgi:hypothetical protein